MLFNSIQFIVFFVLVLIVIFLVKRKDIQFIFLILASYYFYFVSSKGYLALFIVSCVANYYFGNIIFGARKHKRLLLIAAIVFNLGLLGFFKYADFGIIIINDLSALFGHALNFSLLKIFLPIGISFYTFEALSYIFDIYYGKIKPEKHLKNFLLFLAFFPKLIAGPILRASELLPQFKKNKIRIVALNIKIGLTLMLWGFFKKIVIADNIAPFVDKVFINPTQFSSSLPILLGAIAFGIQIYCDFSGYSDIAIGIAKIFGIDFPLNFSRPYLSKNPAEFWRRWHITLSSWVKDYIHTPVYVFFSKKRLFTRILDVELRTKIMIYLGTFIAMFIIGIWHGAYWNFVIFGIYFGVLIVSYYVILDLRKKVGIVGKVLKNRATGLISVIVTFYLVMLGFLMFRLTNLNNLFFSLKKFISFDFANVSGDIPALEKIFYQTHSALLFAIVFIVVYLVYYFIPNIDIKKTITDFSALRWIFVIIFIFVLIMVFMPSKTGTFVYFQF